MAVKWMLTNKIEILLVVLVLFSFIGIVIAENDRIPIHLQRLSWINSSIIENNTGENVLTYNKYSDPIFALGNETLIHSLNASYSLNNIRYEKPFYSFSDESTGENLFLAYTIMGYKYLGLNATSGGTCIPLIFAEEQQDAPDPYCMKYGETLPNGTIISGSTLISYATTIPEIDIYMNNPSYEGRIVVNYIIINPEISEVSPIVLNLGKWPIRVNDEKIDDILDKPIVNDTIMVFGSKTSMILNKGGNNPIKFFVSVGNNTLPTILQPLTDGNPDFSYIFYQENGNYFLKIQRTTQIPYGMLSLFFRPIDIEYAINIEDPIVENTLSFLDTTPGRLRFKPLLQINISNNEIEQLNFEYVTNGNLKYTNIPLDPNGTYIFNKYLDANGNAFYFPFDQYSSTIVVNPPLLISSDQEIPTQINSGFDAKIEINYDNIKFEFTRSLESVIMFVTGLIFVLIGLIYLFFKPESTFSLIFVSIFGMILSTVSLLTSNGLNHIVSIGSVLLLASIIITIIISYYVLRRKNSKKECSK